MSEEYDHPKGGEQSYEGDGPNLRYDDFVGRIVQDPNAPPNVTLLSGYLGSSSEEGHVRLYLDEELCRYVEIPEKAIRHTRELPPEQSPLGGSLVWIDRDAEVLHGKAGAERRKATFLEGQIAQDYIGGAVGHDATIGVGGILPTDMGPGCGQSQFGPCIPKTEFQICRTLTGIFCTRFGPGCRRTIFEPNCHTVLLQQCQSVYNLCVTQHQSYCVESGFRGCSPIDFTYVPEEFGQQQFGQQAAFAGGGAQGFAAIPRPTMICPPPTINISCQSRLVAACFTRFPNECQFETAVRCISRIIRCPTVSEPRCRISAVAFCPDTVAGCQFESVACGFDPAGERVAQRINVGGGGFDPTFGVFQTGFNCPSVFDNCATQESFCPTQDATCPSRFVICQSQFGDCGITRSGCVSSFIRCPTVNFNCPSVAIRCPTRGEPRCFASRVAICPDTRAGCQFDTAVCGFDPPDLGVDPAAGRGQEFQARAFAAPAPPTPNCPGGGGGGGYGGGGGGAAFGAIAAQQTAYCQAQYVSRFTPCPSHLFRCPSQLIACPSVNNYKCPTLPNNGCGGSYTRFGACETFGACPSAVDACPSRFGCYETAMCGESIACFPGGGGGGFDPGGGRGGFGGGF